jgi:tetratricopeptide (TPR) repeat protein
LRSTPNLADAHAGLGDAYRLFGIYGLMPTLEASELARAALERALAIDPDQVEALATLANIMHAFEWNYAEARALSDRTLQRDPSHVRALAESAVTLSTSMAEHPSEGLRQLILDRIARARALDPLSAWAMAVEAMILSILGRDQDAVDAAARAVATDPNNFTAHWSRVLTFAKQNRAAEAEEAAKPGLAMSSRHPILLTDLATLHARGGDMAGGRVDLPGTYRAIENIVHQPLRLCDRRRGGGTHDRCSSPARPGPCRSRRVHLLPQVRSFSAALGRSGMRGDDPQVGVNAERAELAVTKTSRARCGDSGQRSVT